jgi:ABC-type ATPase with predicted acetyltransferase domain
MKYRQRGYRDDEYESDRREAKREKPPDLGNREQIRSLRHAIDRETIVVTRCGKCGHQVPASQLDVDHQTTCLKCGTALHSCRHCKHFDPQARFECREAVETRIADKWAANDCPLFKPVQALDATGRRANSAEDARSAFHNLFKS